MDDLEKFLAGVPITDELARLKAGIEETAEPEEEDLALAFGDPDAPLGDDDRQALRRLMFDPGWRVVQRLKERTCRELEKAAILVSQVDPLGNAEKVARGWAYLMVARELQQTEKAQIAAEIRKLKKKPEEGRE